jgi:ribosome recycling factor
VANTLDQDVQALREWLRGAWHYLAQPSLTRYDRQEMRQQMKLVEEKLRIAIRNVAVKDTAARAVTSDHSDFAPPNWRLLKIEGLEP